MGEDVNYPHPPLLINTFVTKDRLYSPTHDKDDSEDDGCLAMNVALYRFKNSRDAMVASNQNDSVLTEVTSSFRY